MLTRRVLVLPFLALLTFAAREARGQTSDASQCGPPVSMTAPGNESIDSSGASRFLLVNGTYSEVASELNGINFADCEQDLRLDFGLSTTGFSGSHIEVWAGVQGVDCTVDSNRTGTGIGVAHMCWQIAAPVTSVGGSLTVQIFARDLLRYEQPPTQASSGQPYGATFHDGAQGESACHVQPSDASVPLTLFFLPVNSSGQGVGTPYAYCISADLVGPPAPTGVTVKPGDTMLSVTWNGESDTDVAGFAVWSDPPGAGRTTGGCSCGQTPGAAPTSYVAADSAGSIDATGISCVEGSAEASTKDATDAPEEATGRDVDGEVEAPDDAGAEADQADVGDAAADAGASGEDGPREAGAGDAATTTCNPIHQSGGCYSHALMGHSFAAGSPSPTTAPGDAAVTTDASGNSTDGGSQASVPLGSPGISEIDPMYRAGDVGNGTTSLDLTGLTNGTTYVVGVTAVDAFGNVGPISAPQCAQPAAANDFWGTYKQDANGAGASGCALELGPTGGASYVALGVAAAATAFVRRRLTATRSRRGPR